ncbi:sensor histidine kinase [Arachidicoccus sp.]|uniref:sensor histidine kinase n=1 Tax=Arachidicoccus sp. TaxID=1872624 RepID=UPI003D1CC968
MARWFYAEKLKEEVSKQQLETELSLLRSQVNPHFLFNTLNSIYSLTLTNNEKAPDAVMKLSRIMRYTLEEAQSEFVPLEDELAFINSYLELQKIRVTDKVQVIYEVKGNDGDTKIPPLLLIPFIENAFKYGVSARNKTSIKVIIVVENKQLFFNCENDIIPNISMQPGTGLGIANVRRRLELLYKKNYTLNISTEEDKYKVVLRLEIG